MYCELSRGLAVFLHSVHCIETTQLPTAGSTTCSEEKYSKAHEVYKNSGPGLYHQMGLTIFHTLRDYALKAAAQGAPVDSADGADCASALRHRITARHGKLQEFLIAYQQHRLTPLGLSDIHHQSPVETIVKTLAALEPIAQALHSLNATHQATKEAAGHTDRLIR